MQQNRRIQSKGRFLLLLSLLLDVGLPVFASLLTTEAACNHLWQKVGHTSSSARWGMTDLTSSKTESCCVRECGVTRGSPLFRINFQFILHLTLRVFEDGQLCAGILCGSDDNNRHRNQRSVMLSRSEVNDCATCKCLAQRLKESTL